MLEIFYASATDGETAPVPFTTREEARLFVQLEYENVNNEDSANFGITFEKPTEAQLSQFIVGATEPDMYEFMVLSSTVLSKEAASGSWYWFIRTDEVYETVDEAYRASHTTEEK